MQTKIPSRKVDTEVYLSAVREMLKKGDMAFYQRITGQYVMHKIWFIKQGADGRKQYYFIENSQSITEGPIYREQIFGLITAVCRKGKWIKSGDFWWELFRCIWLRLVSLRRKVMQIYSCLNKKWVV